MVEFRYLVLCKHRMNLMICWRWVHRRFVVCGSPSMLSDYKFSLLTVKGTDNRNLTTYLETHKQQICDVPISNRSLNSFDVYTTQDIEIPPFTMCNISCHISKEDKPLPTKIGEGAVLFEIVAVNVSDLSHLRDTVLAYTDPSAVSIPLFNDTNDYY